MRSLRVIRIGSVWLAAGLLACGPAGTGPDARARSGAPGPEGTLRLRLAPDRTAAHEAGTMTQYLELQGAAGAVSLTVTYDARALAVESVRGAAGLLLFSGEPRPGVLHLTIVGQGPLPSTPLRLVFARQATGAAWPRLQRSDAASLGGTPMRTELVSTALGRTAVGTAAFPVAPTTALEAAPPFGATIQAPGVARFGDINGDGRVSVADVVVLGQASVGVRTIVGDAFVAANVAPSAAAGRLTGIEADGQARLSVADLTLVNQATVGTLIGAVGQVIPATSLGPRALVTPMATPVAARSTACTARLAAADTPFANPASGEPWPECVAADGAPMVVQFCLYEKSADLRWQANPSTAASPRCLAELAQVQRGGL